MQTERCCSRLFARLKTCKELGDFMKALRRTTVSSLAIILAGSLLAACSSSGTPATPAGGSMNAISSNPVASSHATSKRPHDDGGWGWGLQVVAPLAFDGSNFSLATNPCDLFDAPIFSATSSSTLVSHAFGLTAPTCSQYGGWMKRSHDDGGGDGGPHSAHTAPALYVIAIQLPQGYGSGHDHHYKARPHDFSSINVQLVAGPQALGATSWSFAPTLPTATTTAGSQYAFFVAAVTLSYTLDATLTFDGNGNFTEADNGCGHGGLNANNAPEWTSGITGTLPYHTQSLAAVCLPDNHGWGDDAISRPHDRPTTTPGNNPVPIVAGDLYIIGVNQVSCGHDNRSHDDCHDSGWSQDNAQVVAGSALPTDNPLVMTSGQPFMQVTAGTNYAFFVGQLQPILGGDNDGDGD